MDIPRPRDSELGRDDYEELTHESCNIVRRELGLPVTSVPAADPRLQIDVIPGRAG